MQGTAGAGWGGILDGALVAAFVVHAGVSGLRARRSASRGPEEYFLAGRRLSGWSAGFSMAATQFAADTPLLVTGLVATAGIFALWRLWIYALAFLLLGFVLAPAWRRARVITDAELSELRYAGPAAAALRVVKALYLGTLFNCTVLAMVLLAAARVAEPFLTWHLWLPPALFDPLASWLAARELWLSPSLGPDDALRAARSASNGVSLVLLVAFTGLYSATGGLRAVVRTDVAQLAVMMVATAGYAVWVVAECGGPAALAASLAERTAAGTISGLSLEQLLAFTPDRARNASFVLLALFGIQWIAQMNADGTGYLAQRSMACRSDAEARRAAIVFSVVQVGLRSLVWLPIALGLLVLFPADPELAGEALRADREASFVSGMAALPPGLRGLMLTAMLAALASTVDSHLNWGASYWSHDLYGRFWCRQLRRRDPTPRALVNAARLSHLGILLVALAILPRLSSIQTAWQASLLLGAGTGVMLVLRWLWWRISARGELAALLAATALAPLLLWGIPPEREALRLLTMAAGATAAGIGVSLWLGPESPETLERFCGRVRPPGLWAPFDGGRGRVRLARGLAATGAGALALFCALTGLGSALVAAPPPALLPWRGPWIALLLGAAVALAATALWVAPAVGGAGPAGNDPEDV